MRWLPFLSKKEEMTMIGRQERGSTQQVGDAATPVEIEAFVERRSRAFTALARACYVQVSSESASRDRSRPSGKTTETWKED